MNKCQGQWINKNVKMQILFIGKFPSDQVQSLHSCNTQWLGHKRYACLDVVYVKEITEMFWGLCGGFASLTIQVISFKLLHDDNVQ